MRRFVKITVEDDGLWGELPTSVNGRTRVPVGVLRDGAPALVLQHWEDERENCDHCGGLMCIGSHDDSDERCGRCNKSHLDCEGSNCERGDAELCIDCDGSFCSDCWTGWTHVHQIECARAIRDLAAKTVLGPAEINMLRAAARGPIMESDIGPADAEVNALVGQRLLHWQPQGCVPTPFGMAVLERNP